MDIKIRRAVHEDSINIIKAHRRSISEVCSKDYNSDQIAVWAGRDFKVERWHQNIDNNFVWVIADEDNKIYGFGHLAIQENIKAQIAGLYFVPEVIGKGFGKSMFQLMKQECEKNEIPLITLESSKTAKTFYKSLGFQEEGEAFYQMGDQLIESFKMKLILR